MTTKVIGGTVRDIADNPIERAEITITLLTKVAFRTSDDSSLVPTITEFSAADGTWSTVVECNDTITPEGTLYEVKEDYSFGGWKTYLIQVLSTLPVGTNQVLDLIVPEMSPVGVVNSFLTQSLADELYEPLGEGGEEGGVSVTEYSEETTAPAQPTGPTVVAIRADSLSAQGLDGQWVALRVTSKGELYCKIMDSVTVLGPLTDAQLRATPVPISGALTDAQLRATPVPVTGGGGGTEYLEGAVDSTITGQAMLWEDTGDTLRAISAAKPLPAAIIGTAAVSGPLTDAQLRASAVPTSLASVPSHAVTGPLTDAQLRATPVSTLADTELPAAAALADNTPNPTVPGVGSFNLNWDGANWDRQGQPLTDTQLRASAVPVSLASVPSHAVTGPLTNTELRATAVPVSVSSLPTTPAGTNNIGDVDVLTMPAITGTVAVSSLPTTPAGTNNIGDVDVLTLPTTPAGTNVIGKVAAETVATAAPTSVAVSTTSAQLLASNASRKGFMIFNDTAVPLFVKFGTTASGTSLNVKIPAAAVYEQPVPGGWVYTGRIDGILGSGSGNAYVTEV